MKITSVTATPLNVPATLDAAGIEKSTSLSVCLVRIETDAGHIGHGITAITEEEVIAAIIKEIAAPALIGADPLAHEALWERLYWLLAPRGQTGYALHAMAAIDIALWDIKGKHYATPVWRLLGAARSKVPVYTTFGFGSYSRDELATAAKWWVARGHRRLKMVVGHHALQRRDEPRPIDELIREDAARVRAVREAVGPDVAIYIDANCSLDAHSALKLARALEHCDIAFFEEPVTQNDAQVMRQMRNTQSIPISGGQNEGLAWRFRELLEARDRKSVV